MEYINEVVKVTDILTCLFSNAMYPNEIDLWAIWKMYKEWEWAFIIIHEIM